MRGRWARVWVPLVIVSAAIAGWTQTDAASWLRRADADARAGRFDAAREEYGTALRLGASLEQDATRSHLLAESYANSSPRDLTAAIRWFQNALRLTGDERVRAELADTEVMAGAYEDAAAHYAVLSKAHPASTVYMIALSRALLQAGRAEEALQSLQSWLARTPGAVAVRLEYARILSYQKHFAEARQQYETVLNTEPTNLIAQIGVAKVTSWQGDQETALGMYERVLTHNPSNYDALVGKAFSLLWMGRSQEALSLLQAAARRNPNDADVREALSHLHGSESLPPIAAAPPSLPEVPAAAPEAQGEAAPRISVQPPTSLPAPTAAQRSAGARTFTPEPFHPRTAKKGAASNHEKASASKEQPATTPAAPEDSNTEPGANVFGFRGLSNAHLVIIFFIAVVLLSMALFVMSSRDHTVGDDWHDKPRSQSHIPIVKVSRAYRPRDAAQRPAAEAPESEQVDRTLSGIPRQADDGAKDAPETIPEIRSTRSVRPRPPVYTPPVVAPSMTQVTQILPRAQMEIPTVRLNGLRILLVGSEPILVNDERRALRSAEAEVLVEPTWESAISRMSSDVIHAIVLNEGGGDQARRIYQTVVEQYPGWLRRMLLVLSQDDESTREFMSTCRAKCIMLPLRPGELLVTVGSIFGRSARAAASPGV